MTTPNPHTTTRAPSQHHIRIVGYTVAIVAFLADLATKIWAQNALADGHRIYLIGDYLSFILLYNPGAAFSFGDNATIIFTLLALAFTIALTILIWRNTNLTTATLYALLLGGTLGNLYDRLFQPPAIGRGHVIDFINYNGFFVGNVADIWIVASVALLLVHTLTHNNTQ